MNLVRYFLFLFLFCLICLGCSGSGDGPTGQKATDVIGKYSGVLYDSLYETDEVARINIEYTSYYHYDSRYNYRAVERILVRNYSSSIINVTVTVIQGASFRTITIENLLPNEYRTVNVWWQFPNDLWFEQECDFVFVPSGVG